MPDMDETAILEAWRANAEAWTAAVRGGAIGSRVRVTDKAVVDAVLRRAPRSVLDLGCGEGWLARALVAHGIGVIGIDAEPVLVERASRGGGGRFMAMTYAQVVAGELDARVDVAVLNFALLAEHGVGALLAAVPRLLEPGGALVVQTVHPHMACGDMPYRDGWRCESWQGFGDGFRAPSPWYFRTLESWLALLSAGRMRLAGLREPVDPATGRPVSLLLVAEPA